MEKIKPAVDAAAVRARMLKDEKGTLVRLALARKLFLWTGFAYFLLVLAAVSGMAAGNETADRLVAQGSFVAYPVFLMSLAMLAHAAWSHAAYVRRGARSVPVATVLLAVAVALLALPHFGVDAPLFKALTGVDLSDAGVRSLLDRAKSLLPL